MEKENHMKNTTQKITLSAILIAVGLVLPFFTGQVPQIGNMLLPMHLPVFLCGLICGWPYGLAVGLILPLLRSFTFGMPPFYPIALAMAFELATYGFVSGFLYSRSRWQCMVALYRSLIAAMLCGRIVWGIAEVILLGMGGKTFTWQMFVTGALLNAVPGIILQLVMIPAIMVSLHRTGLVPFHTKRAEKDAVYMEN